MRAEWEFRAKKAGPAMAEENGTVKVGETVEQLVST